MTARREPPPPRRYDLQHQPASQDRLTGERDAAERHAWDALSRYKLVAAARRHRRRRDDDSATQPGRP